MSYLLHIETSTTVCSVALSKGEEVLHAIAHDNGYSHAENLHPFIQRLMQESGVSLNALAGIAVSKGPGSYTGLRIGVSAAKGLAYALNIPLISVDTLEVMSHAAKIKNPEAHYFCPMLDARRMEVYTNVYDRNMQAMGDTQALILTEESVSVFSNYQNICFFGNGFSKAITLLSNRHDVSFIDQVSPQAANMAIPANKKFEAKNFEDTVYFEPFYLKDFLILKKAKV